MMAVNDFTFEHVDVKSELVAALKKELPKHGFGKVKVLKADPQGAAELPCIGINRTDDSEGETSISDAVETRYDRATETYYQVFGSFFSESVEVRIWHTNADERDRLYRNAKAVLLAMRLKLVEKGLLNITLRSGRDEQDSSMQQAPMVLYWATITMSYLNPLNVTFAEVVPAVTGVPNEYTADTTSQQPTAIASGRNGAGTSRSYP